MDALTKGETVKISSIIHITSDVISEYRSFSSFFHVFFIFHFLKLIICLFGGEKHFFNFPFFQIVHVSISICECFLKCLMLSTFCVFSLVSCVHFFQLRAHSSRSHASGLHVPNHLISHLAGLMWLFSFETSNPNHQKAKKQNHSWCCKKHIFHHLTDVVPKTRQQVHSTTPPLDNTTMQARVGALVLSNPAT